MLPKASDIFFAKVWSAIEKGGNDLMWPSESDYPLTATKISKVDFLFEKTTGAKWTKDGARTHRLWQLKQTMPGKRWSKGWPELIKLFWDRNDVDIYKVPVQSQMEEGLGQPATEFRLYVLRDMGFYKVGFFTTLIET